MHALGLRSRLFLGAGAVLVTSSLGIAASQAAGPVRAIGVVPVGETAQEFVGRVHQEGVAFTQYGYLTHVAGIPDALLFSDPNFRDESHARITFYSKTTLTARSVIDTVFSLNTAGDTRLYFQANPNRQPTDATAFAQGVQIANYTVRVHDILNVQAPNVGIATASESLVQHLSKAFTLQGKRYRLGRVGLRQRLTATGEGKRSSLSPLVSDIVIAGDVVVTG